MSPLPLNAPGAPLFRDHLETKAAAWMRPWDGVERADVVMLGAPLSKTSISHSGASQTPQAMREMLGALTTYDIGHDVELTERLVARDAGDAIVHVTDLARSRAGICDAVAAVLARAADAMMILLGGDHSITAPAVEAFHSHVGDAVGLIQLDAHMDLRNLDDGGPSNGTPIRQLIDRGTLEGCHIVQMGLHPFANARAYRDVARTAGITQLTARDVETTSSDALAQRALAVAGANTAAIYVTLDMDVLAQAFAPGVPALVPGGMTPWKLLDIVYELGRDARVRALDIVEVDPTQDPRRQTVRTAAHALLMFLSGYASRENGRGGA
jgi:formiminoglutamase